MTEREQRISVLLDLVLSEALLNDLDPNTTDDKIVQRVKTAVVNAETRRQELATLETTIIETVKALKVDVDGIQVAMGFIYDLFGEALAPAIDAEIAVRAVPLLPDPPA